MAKTVSVSVPHSLGAEGARQRIAKAVDAWLAAPSDGVRSPTTQWRDDTFSFSSSVLGQQVSGEALVADRAVTLSLTLPLAFSMFSGKIAEKAEKQLSKMLA